LSIYVHEERFEDGGLGDEEVVDAHCFVDGEVGENGTTSESGASIGQMDVLKEFALDESMVARNAQYVLGNEVPCKAFFLGKRCMMGKLIPTEGFYKGHECNKCHHFFQNICVGEFFLC